MWVNIKLYIDYDVIYDIRVVIFSSFISYLSAFWARSVSKDACLYQDRAAVLFKKSCGKLSEEDAGYYYQCFRRFLLVGVACKIYIIIRVTDDDVCIHE